MKYKARFTGRRVNAIGVTYLIETDVEGDNEDDARINLYREYDHIFGLTLTKNEDELNVPQGDD